MADSHLDLSSFISGSSFVNVDPLIISPTAWTTSPSATAQRPPDEVQEDSGAAEAEAEAEAAAAAAAAASASASAAA
jgi:hypothetical protein